MIEFLKQRREMMKLSVLGLAGAAAVGGGTVPPGYDSEFLPNNTDWLGRWRYVQNMENDYLIDREAQRTTSYTGIVGINQQDQAITESMGLLDRSFENLAPSDIAVARGRRRLLRAVEAMAAGERPPAADAPEAYAGVRGGFYTTAETGDWLEIHAAKIAETAAVHSPA